MLQLQMLSRILKISPLQDSLGKLWLQLSHGSVPCVPRFEKPSHQDDERLEEQNEVQAFLECQLQNISVPNAAGCYSKAHCRNLIVNCDYTEAWMSIMCSPFQNPGRQDDERLEQEDEVQASSFKCHTECCSSKCCRLLQKPMYYKNLIVNSVCISCV